MLSQEARYDYTGYYRDFERADAILQDLFASGQVSEGDRPKIERRVTPTGTFYLITLPMA